MKISIRPDGKIEHIYSDRLAYLTDLGKSETKRISSVEPTEKGDWLVDLSPIGGPKLGPFSLREDALQAEVKWVERNYLGGGK